MKIFYELQPHLDEHWIFVKKRSEIYFITRGGSIVPVKREYEKLDNGHCYVIKVTKKQCLYYPKKDEPIFYLKEKKWFSFQEKISFWLPTLSPVEFLL